MAAALGWIGGSAKEPMRTGKHTALVDLQGVIGVESRASADKMIAGARTPRSRTSTRRAWCCASTARAAAPCSPGYINDEIRRLRAKYPDIPLHAVVQDLCASGGYYVAVAADRIYVDKASLVGSIGVIMSGFGFTGTMEKLGVERRAYTAGENKDFLDPFAPENPAHKEHAKQMLGEIHQQFIKVVRDGRGKRLKESPEIFSGLVWTGRAGRRAGARRRLRQPRHRVARDVIKAENVVDFTPEENYFEQLSKRLGAGAAESGREGPVGAPGGRRGLPALARMDRVVRAINDFLGRPGVRGRRRDGRARPRPRGLRPDRRGAHAGVPRRRVLPREPRLLRALRLLAGGARRAQLLPGARAPTTSRSTRRRSAGACQGDAPPPVEKMLLPPRRLARSGSGAPPGSCAMPRAARSSSSAPSRTSPSSARATGRCTSTNRFLSAIIETSPIAIYATDLEGMITLWNPAAERTFGFTRAEALGRRAPFVPAEKKDEARALRERVLAGEVLTDLQLDRRRADGTKIHHRRLGRAAARRGQPHRGPARHLHRT